MNKVLQRLLIFFFGVPVVIGLVWLDFFNHIALHIMIIAVTLQCSTELYTIFSKNISLQPRGFVMFVSIIPSATAFVLAMTGYPLNYLNYSILAGFLIILAYEVFTVKEFTLSNQHLVSSFFVLFYGGYLFTFLSRLTTHTYARQLISSFLFMVFMCDSIAWLTGSLFGKNNKGIIAASPNKSVAGFIGGYLGAVASALIARMIWPEVFFGPAAKTILMGLVISTAAIIGDLAESVFKRSANCKDSGFIIPGRGGILDSIDSILYAAPVFFAVVNFLFSK